MEAYVNVSENGFSDVDESGAMARRIRTNTISFSSAGQQPLDMDCLTIKTIASFSAAMPKTRNYRRRLRIYNFRERLLLLDTGNKFYLVGY